jgi:hypothetical protein
VRGCQDQPVILDTQAKTAKTFLTSKKKYVVETIRFPAKVRFARNSRLGDLAIVLHNVGKTTDVYPPSRVLYTRAYKAEGVARIGVHFECREDGNSFYWSKFRKAALSAGVEVGKHTCREIRNLAQRKSLLGFFKSKA